MSSMFAFSGNFVIALIASCFKVSILAPPTAYERDVISIAIY